MFGFSLNGDFAKTHALALDIGTSEISAAVFTKNKKHVYDKTASEGSIVKVFKYPVFLFKGGAGVADENFSRILNDILLKVFKEAHSASKHLDKIFISVADPFFVDEVMNKKVSRLRPESAISSQELARTINDLKLDAVSRAKNLVLAGYELLGTRINGYAVENAVGYKGKSLEVAIISTFISNALKNYVDSAKKTFFPKAQIEYLSDARVLWKMLKKTENLNDPVMAVHINGEMTGVFNFEGGFLEHAGAYALGARTLERRIAIFLKKEIAEAESILKRYSEGVLEESARKKVDSVLSAVLADWGIEFAKNMEYFKLRNFPQKIVLSGPGSDFKIFADLINAYFKKHFNKDAELQNVTAQGLKDFINPPTALYGGKDVLLASLIFLSI